MKKLFFAAIASIVMVSVSNVFANNSKANLGVAIPDDTTTVDSISPAEQPAETPVDTPVDTTVDTTVNDSSESNETAMLMFSDTTNVDSTKTDTTTQAIKHDVA